jgi:hypothetical protein
MSQQLAFGKRANAAQRNSGSTGRIVDMPIRPAGSTRVSGSAPVALPTAARSLRDDVRKRPRREFFGMEPWCRGDCRSGRGRWCGRGSPAEDGDESRQRMQGFQIRIRRKKLTVLRVALQGFVKDVDRSIGVAEFQSDQAKVVQGLGVELRSTVPSIELTSVN